MQKRKKQLLGFAGLAAVAGMTAIALSLPASAAEPTSDSSPTLKNGATTITVNVVDNNPQGQVPSAQISSPQGNAELTEIPAIVASYSNATGMELKVTRTRTVTGANGETTTSQEVVATLTNAATGTGTWTIPAEDVLKALNETPMSGDSYELALTVRGANDSKAEDKVTFRYRAVSVEFNGDTAANKDPMVQVTANSTATRFVMQAYNSKREPLFVNADGTEEPLTFTDEVLNDNGVAMITLPFAKYGVPTGEYELATVAYNANGDIVSINTTKVKYTAAGSTTNPEDPNDPDTPDVPGTGSMLFGNLNISRADYLVTGLIAFSAMIGFAMYLVFRKSRR